MDNLLNKLEEEIAQQVPLAYKNILENFQRIYALELSNGKNVDFLSLTRLHLSYSRSYKRHQMITSLIQDYCHAHKSSSLQRHDSDEIIDAAEFNSTLYFANMGDDARLFFNLKDWTVWEFWMEDNSVAKIASTFEAFILDSSVDEHDD